MNKVLCSGSFRKVAYKDGGSFMFKLGVKRDYKNKETGKYDYDNITMYIPSFNKTVIEFVKSYVNDGDNVEVEAHLSTYATEKEGNKVYHQDVICDAIRVTGKQSEAEKGESAVKEEKEEVVSKEIEVNNTDVPW